MKRKIKILPAFRRAAAIQAAGGGAGRRSRSVLLLGLLAGTSFSFAGCVKYIPVELDSAPREEELRVRLTDAGAIRAARQLGRIRSQLDAAVRPVPPDSVAVIVWLGKDYPGTQFENVRETVVLPREEVVDVSLRRLSVPRTAAVFAGTAALVGYMANRIFFQEDPNPHPDQEEQKPPPAGFTLIRIPIGHNP